MKKIYTFVLIALAMIMVAGCSSSKTETAIRIATDPTWPPFEMMDEDSKEITGFEIDLMKAIAENQKLNVEFVNVNFDALIPGIGTCQYEIGASTITVTEERKNEMLFSEPFIQIGQLMAVKEDVDGLVNKEDFKDKIIGAQTGTTGAIMAAEWQEEGIGTLRGYDTVDLAYMDLKNGQIDGVLGDSTMAESYAKSLGGIKTVGENYSSEDIAFAVCKDNKDMVDKLNAGLKAVKESGKYDELISQYFTN